MLRLGGWLRGMGRPWEDWRRLDGVVGWLFSLSLSLSMLFWLVVRAEMRRLREGGGGSMSIVYVDDFGMPSTCHFYVEARCAKDITCMHMTTIVHTCTVEA